MFRLRWLSQLSVFKQGLLKHLQHRAQQQILLILQLQKVKEGKAKTFQQALIAIKGIV